LAGRIRYYREAGMEALREGRVGQAEELLRLAVDLGDRDQAVDTTKAHSIYRLGLVLHEAGRPDEAAGNSNGRWTWSAIGPVVTASSIGRFSDTTKRHYPSVLGASRSRSSGSRRTDGRILGRPVQTPGGWAGPPGFFCAPSPRRPATLPARRLVGRK